jgi:hypothetical protein
VLKPDEVSMIQYALVSHLGKPRKVCPMYDWMKFSGMNYKRMYYLLEKWTDRGHWEYGTNPRGGWFTTEGVEWAAAILGVQLPGGVDLANPC